MIPQETVSLILDTARIEEVVGDFVTLKRRGANFVACCPFHNEKTPSFYVSPSKGIYKCFGCGKAGSAVHFVMEHEHSTYVEALRYLARKYSIEIVEKEESAEELALKQRRESLLLVSEFAQRFYSAQLSEPEGRAVGYAYFRSRSLEDETIRTFGLGWAPSGRNGSTTLVQAALAEGFKMEYLLGAGLAVQREDGSIVDKFRERVMFPIHTVSGRVVAFSGRTLRSDNPAKYVNSPETEIYVKSRNLLGIYFAKSEINRLGKCILVEGNVDMVMMHQTGIRNVVASCGTSLTVEQIRLIHKFTENVTIMYDGDSAGIHAALRGIDLILAEGLNVKVLLLPDGEDPDSFCRSHTLQQVEDFIASEEKDFINFKTDLLLSSAGDDPLKKANLINDISDSVAQIPDAVKRSVYVQSIAKKFGIETDILFERIRSTRQKKLVEEQRAGASREKARESVQAPPSEVKSEVEDYSALTLKSLTVNDIVGPVEQDILYFLLRHGRDTMDFETDSEFYDPDEKFTVADFIISTLEDDGGSLLNPAYQKVYEQYVKSYDEGFAQSEILRRLLDSPDAGTAFIAAQLSTEKYQLTVQNFREALTTTSSWLVTKVPYTLILYADRKIESALADIRKALAVEDEARQEELLKDMVRLQSLQKTIKEKMKK